MATILKADVQNKTMVTTHRIHLTAYFLNWSLKHAAIAVENQKPSNVSEASISSIIFSALFIEAFIYQLAEDFVNDDEMNAFDRCKGKTYKNRSGGKLKNTTWKLRHMLNEKAEPLLGIDDPLLLRVDAIIQTRHKLIHYKPEENAAKLHRPLPILDESTISLDLRAPVIEVEESLVERKARCQNAVEHYMTCRELMLTWYEAVGAETSPVLQNYPELSFER